MDEFGETPFYKLRPGWFWRDTGNGDGGGGGGGDDSDDSDESDDQDDTKPEGKKEEPKKGDDLEGLKSALKKERKARREAERALRDSPRQDDDDDEFDEDEYFAEVEEAALGRMLEAEVKVAAAGKVVDPEIVVALLMDEEFDVDEDGNFDRKQIDEAIDDLLKERPYLSAKRRSRSGGDFSGSGGGDKAPDMNDILRGAVKGA